MRASLDVAEDKMNQAFRRAQVTDVPIIPADLLKPNSTTQAAWDEDIERLTQWLRMVCLRLAGTLISTGQSGTGSKIDTDNKWATEELAAVRENKQRLSLVPYNDPNRYRLVRV